MYSVNLLQDSFGGQDCVEEIIDAIVVMWTSKVEI